MHRAFKYRLWTNANQERELGIMLETHRRLYNHLLAQRIAAWECDRVRVGFPEQSRYFTSLRKVNPYMERIGSDPGNATARRLDQSYQNFFRRVKGGAAKAGFPRFKGKDHFHSFAYPHSDNGFKLIEKKLRLRNIGTIRVNLHRPVEGTIKNATIKREAEKWYVVFVCDLGAVEVPKSANPSVGVDVGLEAFATLSTGERVENPRYLKAELPELRRRQRSLSRAKRGGSNRRKAIKQVSKLYARVRNSRQHHHHQTALSLTRRYGLVAVESLNVQGMVKNRRFARAISDAGWSSFVNILKHKAESAGVQVVEVDPRGTSQACSGCGQVVQKKLSERWHQCDCGLSIHRDENAARNILARGLARIEPAGQNAAIASVSREAAQAERLPQPGESITNPSLKTLSLPARAASK